MRKTASIVLSLGAALVAVPTANAFVYWSQGGDDGFVGRAENDGSDVNVAFIPLGSCGVEVNDTHIFFESRSDTSLARAGLDGSAIDRNFIPGAGGNCTEPALDDTYVYWTNQGIDPYVGRARLDGTNADTGFIPLTEGDHAPTGVAVDAQHVFWVDRFRQRIGRADLDGTNAQPDFIVAAIAPYGIALDDQYVYWGNLDSVGRARLDGTEVDNDFIPAPDRRPCGVAVTDTHVWWAENLTGNIRRRPIDGSGVTETVVSGIRFVCGIAVDDLSARSATTDPGPPPAPQASPPQTGAPAAVPPPENPLHALIEQFRRARLRGRVIYTGAFVDCPAPLAASCAGGARARARVDSGLAARTRRLTVGKVGFTVPAGGRREVQMVLTPRGRRIVRRARSLTVTIRVTCRCNPNRTRSTITRTVRLPGRVVGRRG